MPPIGTISPEAQTAIDQAIENVMDHGTPPVAFGGEAATLEDVGYKVQRNERGQFVKAESPPENNLSVEQALAGDEVDLNAAVAGDDEPAGDVAEGETPLVPTDEKPQDEDVSQYVQFAKDFEQGWNGDQRNRAELMANLFKGMTSDEQGKFLQALTGGTAEAQKAVDIPDGYEPVNEAEAFIVSNRDVIKAFPQFQQDVTDVVGNHRENLNLHLARLEIFERNMSALAEALNVALPKTDVAKIRDAISNGKDTAPLFRAHEAELKKAVARKQQAVKERPVQAQSQGNPGGGKPGESLLDFLHRERSNGRIPV